MTLTMTPILRRRLLILVGLVFTLWATWKVSAEDTTDTTVSERIAPAPRRVGSKAPPVAPTLALDWPTRADQRQPVADLFSLAPAPVAPNSAALPAGPPVPVLTLKYVGRLDGGDNNHAFLADAQDQVITVKVGQTVADGWQLTAMDSKQLVLRHIASGHEQTMLIGTPQ